MARTDQERRILGEVSGKIVVIVGGGPTGLFAAEILSAAGCKVHIYDRKPSVARKFLMAGRGGLNLTHSEDVTKFVARYDAAQKHLEPMIAEFTPQNLRDWCDGLGQKTFVGSSGRIFPESMKASPLVRAWLSRLASQGVELHLQKKWRGWDDEENLLFEAADPIKADAVLLALGGASWPGLGSDGSWVSLLEDKGVSVSKLRPANCGFVCHWSDIFKEKFSGQPLKGIAISYKEKRVLGEAMLSAHGIEGGAIYALSSALRNGIEGEGQATLYLDLKPSMRAEDIVQKLQKKKDKQSLSSSLQKLLSLPPIAINLLREARKDLQSLSDQDLAALIKSVPITLTDTFDIDRAISSAGGIVWDELSEDLALKKIPSVFVAGEMIDWEAPTGGYLLQACFATARRAANGILKHLA